MSRGLNVSTSSVSTCFAVWVTWFLIKHDTVGIKKKGKGTGDNALVVCQVLICTSELWVCYMVSCLLVKYNTMGIDNK